MRLLLRWLLRAGCLMVVWSAAAAPAAETTLLFEPSEIGAIGPEPADGVSVAGVSFGFTEGGGSSTAAQYGASGPGALTFIDGDVLAGPAGGTLTLSFATPTVTLEFGLALNTIGTVSPGFSVELFDAGLISLGTTDVDTLSLIGFSEGLFSHSGTAVKQAVVTLNTTFPQIGGNREFALDNLTFEVPDPPPFSVPVPTLGPGGGLALVLLLVALGSVALRRSALA